MGMNDDRLNYGKDRAGHAARSRSGVGRRLMAGLVAVVCLLACTIGMTATLQTDAAYADEGVNAASISTADAAKHAGDGHINVSYQHDEFALPDAQFKLYRVAGWNGSGYEPTKAFRSYAVSWDILNADAETFRQLAQTLSSYAQRDDLAPEATAVSDTYGTLSFQGLSKGLYLVVMSRYAYGSLTCEASSMLVSLPVNKSADDGSLPSSGAASTASQSQSMEANIEPKTDCVTTPNKPSGVTITAHKLWRKDAENDRPAKVEAQLLRDGAVADSMTLNASNGWSHTWNGLESGHDWRVVEKTVPQGYVVSIDREGNTYNIVNSATHVAKTGANVMLFTVIAVVVALAGLIVVAIRRQRE